MRREGRDSKRRREGKAMGALVALLLLCALGAYNYHRNWSAEQSTKRDRPYESYATEDLEKLRDAYAGEVEEFKRRFMARQHQRQRADASTGDLMGENVAEFERVQRSSSALREAGSELASREARLKEVQSELDYRGTLAVGFALHLQRLTSF